MAGGPPGRPPGERVPAEDEDGERWEAVGAYRRCQRTATNRLKGKQAEQFKGEGIVTTRKFAFTFLDDEIDDKGTDGRVDMAGANGYADDAGQWGDVAGGSDLSTGVAGEVGVASAGFQAKALGRCVDITGGIFEDPGQWYDIAGGHNLSKEAAGEVGVASAGFQARASGRCVEVAGSIFEDPAVLVVIFPGGQGARAGGAAQTTPTPVPEHFVCSDHSELLEQIAIRARRAFYRRAARRSCLRVQRAVGDVSFEAALEEHKQAVTRDEAFSRRQEMLRGRFTARRAMALQRRAATAELREDPSKAEEGEDCVADFKFVPMRFASSRCRRPHQVKEAEKEMHSAGVGAS